MLEHGLSDFRLIVLVSMTFMGCLAFPGISAHLWHDLKGIMTSRRTRSICKRKKKREERLKKYWEIDMRNFK